MASQAQADARLALIVAYAADMYRGATSSIQSPPADARLAPDWIIRGYLTGLDAIFRPAGGTAFGAQRVFYGFLAESMADPGTFVIAIRGTDGIVEWIEDAQFALVKIEDGTSVESGFHGLYQSMEFQSVDGPIRPASSGIAAAVGAGTVTVLGHSLGGALATFLALDLARNERLSVKARLFASPRPGDSAFATLFAQWVPDAIAYAYELDFVPRVPSGFGYTPLNCLQLITHATSQARIKLNLACFHHIWCYCACLDYEAMESTLIDSIDRALTDCIHGPSFHM